MKRIDGIKIPLIWQHLGLAKLGRYHVGLDLVAMLPGDVPAHCVVTREGSVTVGTWYSDALMSLSNVSSQIGLVPVGSLTERAFQLCT